MRVLSHGQVRDADHRRDLLLRERRILLADGDHLLACAGLIVVGITPEALFAVEAQLPARPDRQVAIAILTSRSGAVVSSRARSP
jgi:hypothetical protein